MKELFFSIASKYTTDASVLAQFWQELEKNYTPKKRHYHTLIHIKHMLRLAEENREAVEDWDVFVFAIFYHDVVYRVLKSDNEEKSAMLAEKRLTQLGLSKDRIALCSVLILATKTHQISTNSDCNLLLDLDLSILGASWERYEEYARQIRREYSVYPDFLYKPGRKKVLERFLERDFIFKTPAFRAKFEAQARGNLHREISTLP